GPARESSAASPSARRRYPPRARRSRAAAPEPPGHCETASCAPIRRPWAGRSSSGSGGKRPASAARRAERESWPHRFHDPRAERTEEGPRRFPVEAGVVRADVEEEAIVRGEAEARGPEQWM